MATANFISNENDPPNITLNCQEVQYRNKFGLIFHSVFSDVDIFFCEILKLSKSQLNSCKSDLLGLPKCQYSAAIPFTNSMFLFFMEFKSQFQCPSTMMCEIFSNVFTMNEGAPKWDKVNKIIGRVKRQDGGAVFDFKINNFIANVFEPHLELKGPNDDQNVPILYASQNTQTYVSLKTDVSLKAELIELQKLRKLNESQNSELSTLCKSVKSLEKQLAKNEEKFLKIQAKNMELKHQIASQDEQIREVHDLHTQFVDQEIDQPEDQELLGPKFPKISTRHPNNRNFINPSILKTSITLTAKHNLPSNLVNPVIAVVANTCFNQNWVYKEKPRTKSSKRKDTPFDVSENSAPKKNKHDISDNMLPSHSYANQLD